VQQVRFADHWNNVQELGRAGGRAQDRVAVSSVQAGLDGLQATGGGSATSNRGDRFRNDGVRSGVFAQVLGRVIPNLSGRLRPTDRLRPKSAIQSNVTGWGM